MNLKITKQHDLHGAITTVGEFSEGSLNIPSIF